ncbi:uncharacterized protein LOC114166650 [Vigna unguiculata]|uniref:uncharacterized protein LOC114166650 n=1 Tax=Vigna unguiculata TaxID=3917 RepID=UPI001016E5B1|nr:uncharacterized protein LOC114166650 [Vigna unguiculata]
MLATLRHQFRSCIFEFQHLIDASCFDIYGVFGVLWCLCRGLTMVAPVKFSWFEATLNVHSVLQVPNHFTSSTLLRRFFIFSCSRRRDTHEAYIPNVCSCSCFSSIRIQHSILETNVLVFFIFLHDPS